MHQTENELRRAQPTGSQKSKKSSRTGDIGIARATEEFRIESSSSFTPSLITYFTMPKKIDISLTQW